MPRNRNRKRRQSAGAATSAPAAAGTPSSTAAPTTPKRKSKGKRVAPGTAPARRADAGGVTSPEWLRVDKEVALRSAHKKKATASRLGKKAGKANGKGASAKGKAKGKKRAVQPPPSDSSASDSDAELPTSMEGEKPLRGAKRRGAKAVTEADLNAVRRWCWRACPHPEHLACRV